jgi:hypothetical protein
MNFIVELSRDFVSAAAHTAKSEPEIVQEVILGAQVSGSGQSFGVASVEFIPDDHVARMELVVNGYAITDTRADKDPVRVYNSALTKFQARKPVCLTRDGLTSDFTYSASHADIHLDGIETRYSGLVDSVVKRVALRIYKRDQDKSRVISEFLASRKTNCKVDHEANEQLEKGNRDYQEKMIKPLQKRNILPETLVYRTSYDVLTGLGRMVDATDPPAIGAPPAIMGCPAVGLRVHESLLNTGADRLYAGKTVTKEDVEKDLKEFFGESFSLSGRKDDERPFTVIFTREKPFRYSFHDGLVELTLRTETLKSEDRSTSEPWGTTVVYRISKTEKGFKLVREGDLKSRPLNAEPGAPLSGLRVGERRLLHRNLEKIFRKEFELEELEFPDDLKKVGTLETTQVESTAGWLLLAWRRVPPSN